MCPDVVSARSIILVWKRCPGAIKCQVNHFSLEKKCPEAIKGQANHFRLKKSVLLQQSSRSII